MQNNPITILARQVSTHTLDKILVWCILGGAALSKSELLPLILPGVSIGDVLLALASCFILIRFSMGKFKLVSHRGLFYCFCLWLCAFTGGVFLFMSPPPYFCELEFIKSFAKLSFYMIVATLLINYLRKVSGDIIYNCVLNILLISGLIAIYIYVVMALKIEIPYDFFWYGQPEHRITNSFYRATGFVVARGFFSEPSTMGIFMNLGLAFLYFSPNSHIRISTWKHSIVVLSILLTFSLTSYFLLAINIFLYLLKHKNIQLRPLFIFSIIIILLVCLTPIFEFFREAVIHRLFNKVFLGLDNSTMARLFGSWELPLKVMNDLHILGVGIGNLDTASSGMNYELMFEDMRGRQGYNIFAYVLGTMGIIGFGIFILFIADLIFGNPRVGIVFLASMFTTGTFLEPSFWIFYCLFTVQAQRKKWLSKFICRGMPKSRQCIQE